MLRRSQDKKVRSVARWSRVVDAVAGRRKGCVGGACRKDGSLWGRWCSEGGGLKRRELAFYLGRGRVEFWRRNEMSGSDYVAGCSTTSS